MSTRTKAILITIIFGVPAFFLGPVIWPEAIHGTAPVGIQLPLLIAVGALEALAFGMAAAFLILGWKWVNKASAGKLNLRIATYLSIAWSLGSWWAHDRMHMSNGDNMARLIVIEYVFHVTLIVAAMILAYHFFDVLKSGRHAES